MKSGPPRCHYTVDRLALYWAGGPVKALVDYSDPYRYIKIMENIWEGIAGIVMGVALSAACGLRVILPILGLSLAAIGGYVKPAPDFAWIGSWPVVAALTTAAFLEIVAYYIPWMDNFLDAVATPLAVAAGTIVTASLLNDVSPFMRWSLAIIAGGGVAGTVQAGTTLLRGLSTVATGGTTNVLVSSAELAGSALATVLSLFLPFVALLAVAVLTFFFFRKVSRSRSGSAGKG